MALSDLMVKIGADASGFVMGMRKAKGELTTTSNSIKEAENKFFSLQTQLKKADFGSDKWRKLKTDIAAAGKEMDAMRAKSGLLSRGGAGSLAGNIANQVGTFAAGYVGLQTLGDMAGQVFTFEQSLADLKAISGATDSDLKDLEITARKVGESSSFTATQVVDLQTELSKLGFSIPEVKKLSGTVVTLSTALGADASEAAVILGGQLRAFGADASQAAKFAEVLGATANKSAVDFNDFALMLPKVSKAAATVGWDFAQLNATLGVLRDNNIRAEAAGTALRNVLLNNAEAGRTYEEGLAIINSSTDKLRSATELYGAENAIVALTLADNIVKIKESTVEIRGMTGVLAEMNAARLDTVIGQFTLLKSAASELLLTLNNSRSLKDFVSGATDAIKGWTQLFKHGAILGKGFDEDSAKRESRVNKHIENYTQLIKDGKLTNDDFAKSIDKQITAKERMLATDTKLSTMQKATGKDQLDELKRLKKEVLSNVQLGVVSEVGGDTGDASAFVKSETSKAKAVETSAEAYKKVQDELIKTREYLSFVGKETEYVEEASGILQKAMEAIFMKGGDDAIKYASLLRSQLKSIVDESRGVTNNGAVSLLPKIKPEDLPQVSGVLSVGVASQSKEPLAGIIAEQDLENTNAYNDALDRQEQALYNIASASQIMGDAAFGGFANMASGAATAGQAMQQFGSQAAAGIMELVRANIMAAISEQANAHSVLGILGVPLIGAAIGAIFGLMQGAIGKTKGIALAEGGVAFGPTLATVGDNPGASYNPEVIAPLDKLTSIMRNTMSSGGGGGMGEVRFEIAGDKLYGVLKNVERKMSKFQ